MTPTVGLPVHRYVPGDDAHTAAWILELIDASPDRVAPIGMPHAKTDEELVTLEADFSRAYELAKVERPDLAIKLLHGVDVGNGRGNSHIIAIVHEHKWVGGACANGCPDTRPVA